MKKIVQCSLTTTSTAGAGAAAAELEPLRKGGAGGPEDAVTGELSRLCTTSETDGADSAAGEVTCAQPAVFDLLCCSQPANDCCGSQSNAPGCRTARVKRPYVHPNLERVMTSVKAVCGRCITTSSGHSAKTVPGAVVSTANQAAREGFARRSQ